jgi:hypothetical protein
MRRKLRPALIGQLNQLTVPVAGLVVAAAALPEARGWLLLLGGTLAVILGLAPSAIAHAAPTSRTMALKSL